MIDSIFYIYVHIFEYKQISSSTLKQPIVVTQRRREREKKREELSCFYSFLYREKIQAQDRGPRPKHFQNSLGKEWRFSAQQTQTHFHKMSNKAMISLPTGPPPIQKTGDGGGALSRRWWKRGAQRGERCPSAPATLARLSFFIRSCPLLMSPRHPFVSAWWVNAQPGGPVSVPFLPPVPTRTSLLQSLPEWGFLRCRGQRVSAGAWGRPVLCQGTGLPSWAGARLAQIGAFTWEGLTNPQGVRADGEFYVAFLRALKTWAVYLTLRSILHKSLGPPGSTRILQRREKTTSFSAAAFLETSSLCSVLSCVNAQCWYGGGLGPSSRVMLFTERVYQRGEILLGWCSGDLLLNQR